MYLIEIFLPLADNEGRRFDETLFVGVRKELTETFGGVTSFSRVPAHGIVKDADESLHDDIIVIEVMSETLGRKWWSQYRARLEKQFNQDEILIRATPTEKL